MIGLALLFHHSWWFRAQAAQRSKSLLSRLGFNPEAKD
jgi:hypothetical protein